MNRREFWTRLVGGFAAVFVGRQALPLRLAPIPSVHPSLMIRSDAFEMLFPKPTRVDVLYGFANIKPSFVEHWDA